jgi:predicted type IV restriction endonuclease
MASTLTPFDSAFEKVGELVRQFEEHEVEYLAPKYQETEVRTDFIDKFFTALGWDVRHERQTNPREQFQRKCDYLDGEIDRLVYQLYGLTAEEIRIVEGRT